MTRGITIIKLRVACEIEINLSFSLFICIDSSLKNRLILLIEKTDNVDVDWSWIRDEDWGWEKTNFEKNFCSINLAKTLLYYSTLKHCLSLFFLIIIL